MKFIITLKLHLLHEMCIQISFIITLKLHLLHEICIQTTFIITLKLHLLHEIYKKYIYHYIKITFIT